MQRLYFSSLFIVIMAFVAKAQNITVQENLTDIALVEKLFPENSCMTPSNIRISGYQFNSNQKSYGYFRNTNSAFSLTEGILITTGRAANAVGPNNNILSDGPSSWQGDSDLERAINETRTFNATSIEFEILAITNQLSFDYIFSSEQYLSNPNSNQCGYSDGFAFLVKEADNTSATYTNIALIPNTNLPVKVPNVRARTNNCPESYVQYFGGFNDRNHPTNYNGQTKVLTARAQVTPGVRYKFKLVVADQGNEKYDSAIFLSASSFRNSIDLGLEDNVSICPGTSYNITPTPISGVQHYTWYKDNVVINSHNQTASPNLTITEGGTYKLVAYINANCIITEEVTIHENTRVIVPNEIHEVCNFGTTSQPYNIYNNNSYYDVFHQSDEISFHYTQAGAQNNTDVIPPNEVSNFIPQQETNTIYVRVVSDLTGCFGIGTYTINVSNGSTMLPDVSLCNNNSTNIDLAPYLPNNGLVEIYANIEDANARQNKINQTGAIVPIQTDVNNFYILYPNTNSCGDRYSIKVTILNTNTFPEEAVSFCSAQSVNLQAPEGYTNLVWSTGETSQNITVTTEGIYTVTVNTANGCSITKTFNVTENRVPNVFTAFTTICSFSVNNNVIINPNNYVTSLIENGNTFSIYNTNADAVNLLNPITSTIDIVDNTTLFIREQNSNGCSTISTVTFNVTNASVLPSVSVCQLNNERIDVSFYIEEIQNLYPGKQLNVYTLQNDAEANTNALTNYLISETISNLYIKVLDNTSCFVNHILPIVVNSVTDLPTQYVTICQNNSIDLQTVTNTNYTYFWNTGETTSLITIDTIGTYTVTITDENGCNFSQKFVVNQSQIAQIVDIEVRHFSNIQNYIKVITDGVGEVEYSIDGVNFQASNIFYSVKEGNYTVFVRDLNGCGVVSKNTLVLDIRNFFTPNGDGVYDTWSVDNIFRVFPEADIYVMDRYGKIMTYLYPNRSEWDGIAYGQPQPSTDYWYVIKLPNGQEYKGHFSLKR